MKKWVSMLLFVILLLQALPINALEHRQGAEQRGIGARLRADRVGPGRRPVSHGMSPNASMSGKQLAHWLEDKLDTQLHSIDDLLARVRYQLDVLSEEYPTLYKAFTQSPYYSQIQAMAIQVEELRGDMKYLVERLRTDINMISQMRSRLEDDEGALFDSERVRASARVETAVAEIEEIRDYITANAASWDSRLLEWTAVVQNDSGGGSDQSVTDSFRSFLEAAWRKFNLSEDSDEALEAELRALLKKQFLQFQPGSDQVDAFTDDAVALMRRIMQQYDPDGETGRRIL